MNISFMDRYFPKASSLIEQDTEWFIPGMIPYGTLTLVDGDPGSGKSSIVHAILARASQGGELFPAHYIHQAPVVLLDAEESFSKVILRRLKNNGGDLDLIRLGNHIEDVDVSFPTHTGLIIDLMETMGARVLGIDTITNHLDAGINPNIDMDVVRAMRPLLRLAEERNFAIIGLRHLSKGKDIAAKHKGMGSTKWTGLARTAYMVLQDPHTPGSCFLAQTKNSYKFHDTVKFLIKSGEKDSSFVEITGTCALTADDLIRDFSIDNGNESEEVDFTSELKVMLLAGPKRFEELRYEAAKMGISMRSVQRSLKQIGAKPRKNCFGPEGFWEWVLFPKTSSPLDT